MTDLIILGLRLVFILLLYAFLFQIVLVIVRDLPKTSAQENDAEPDRAYLFVVDGGSEAIIPGQRFDLDQVTSIGRAPSNTIKLPDSFVSAEHSILAFRDGQWWLEDLGSTNGTYVNRRLVSSPTPVSFGDVIEIGKTRMKLLRQGSRN